MSQEAIIGRNVQSSSHRKDFVTKDGVLIMCTYRIDTITTATPTDLTVSKELTSSHIHPSNPITEDQRTELQAWMFFLSGGPEMTKPAWLL